MNQLSDILDQMTVILNALKDVMDAEQKQLSVGHVHSSTLQRITEEKSSLLATLDYLEQQRREAQKVQSSANDDIADRWQIITRKTQHLRDLNQHNGWLLEGQIALNRKALEVLKPHQSRGFMVRTVRPLRVAGAEKDFHLANAFTFFYAGVDCHGRLPFATLSGGQNL